MPAVSATHGFTSAAVSEAAVGTTYRTANCMRLEDHRRSGEKTIILVALIDVTGSRCALFYPLDQVVTVHIAIGPYCNQIVSTERYTMRDFDVEDEDVRQSELAEYEQEARNMSDNAEG